MMVVDHMMRIALSSILHSMQNYKKESSWVDLYIRIFAYLKTYVDMFLLNVTMLQTIMMCTMNPCLKCGAIGFFVLQNLLSISIKKWLFFTIQSKCIDLTQSLETQQFMQLQFLKIDEKRELLKSGIKEWVSSVHCFLMDMECSTVGVSPGGQDH